MTKISCILPTYNRIDLATQRIEELLNSTYKDIEIVVINDGGDKFEKNLSDKVKIINLDKNSGSVSIPRNIGITHSVGEFICHVDDDVVQYPKKLELLCSALSQYDTDLVFGQRCELKENKLSYPYIGDWEPQNPNGWGVDNGQIMYKRSVFKKIDLVFSRRACDWELAKKIRSVSNKFISITDVVCCYIWHDKNRSLNSQTKNIEIYPGKFKNYFKWGNIPDRI